MTGNRSYLTDYEEINGGFITFRGSTKEGKITGKCKIRTGKLDFEDVYFVKELKFNLFSVSQMCDKKNSVLFTDIKCVVLSPDFKLTDESHVLFKVPRKDNMYSVDLKNVFPQGGLTCLFEKATPDESNLWHRRLGHVNFKTMNKLVRGNLVRGLPSKLFEINQTSVACQKGKQYRASCKTKTVSSISQPLQMLYMDLFGLTFVKSLMKKMYCLVVTDDFSIENLIDLRVKVIRCDNGTEFKNKVMNQFCEMKGIKREFSVARTSQQNRVAERKNRALIEAARTILAYSKLPTTCWAEAVNTACYVQNRVLVIKPHNKTPYKLFLGKFDGKADEGFFIRYSTNSKALRVFNSRTRIVEENLHVQFTVARNQSNGNACTKACDNAGEEEKKDAEDPGNESGNPTERKDSEVPSTEEPRINQEKDDYINSTNNINTGSDGNSTNNVNVVSSTVNVAGTEVNVVDSKTSIEHPNDPNMPELEDIVYSDDDEDVGALQLTHRTHILGSTKRIIVWLRNLFPRKEPRIKQENDDYINSTNNINTASDGNSTNNVNAVSSTISAAGTEVNAVDPKTSIELPNDPNMPEWEDIVYSDVDAEADMNNLDTFMPVSPIPTTRIHKAHPIDQIIGDLNSVPQTRRMTKNLKEHGLFSSVQQRTNHKDFQNYLFACFLSQEEPKK
ncbi:putative ribonuclease H-like domain-containing protein, partial [Tanacetum coccineum]